MQFGMMDSYGYGMGYGMEILELILDTGNHRACSSYQIPVERWWS